MDKSESIKEIAAALKSFQFTVTAVKKDGSNPFFKSKYATLENILESIKGYMHSFGLSFSQFPCTVPLRGSEGGVAAGLYTVIMHTSGEWIGSAVPLELKGHTPQDQGSAITYMRRYALSAALGLATEDDDDGNAATQAVKAKPIPPKQVANKRDVLKKRIKELVDYISLVELETGEGYKIYVKENTGFELVPDNFESIVDALEGLKANKK